MRPAPALAAALLAVLALPSTAAGPEQRSVTAAPEVEVPVAVYRAAGDTVLVWVPSRLGFAAAEAAHARALAERGIESWMAELLAGRFLPALESSLAQIPAGDVAAVVAAARTATGRRVVLLCTGHGCGPAVRGAVTDSPPDGLILLYPVLLAQEPEAGVQPVYLPEVSRLGVAAVVLQPELSVGRWHLEELADALRRGGARVQASVLPGVRDRFHFREDASAAELALRERFPQLMDEALARLRWAQPIKN